MSARLPGKDVIACAVIEAVAAAGGRTVDPTAVARRLAGPDEKAWSRLMPWIRQVAVALAREGRIAIYRKGRPVDAAAFKGVYRLGPPADQATGSG